MTAPPSAAPGARIELVRQGPTKPWLGQLVPVDVSVWRPEGTTPLEAFSVDDVVAAGMIAKWSEQASPPDERAEGETKFLVQHRTLLVFPQSDGDLTVPPLVARWGEAATKHSVFVASKELHFEAAIPAGAGDTLPLVASSVALEQTFDRNLSSLRVGDGFTRTITLRATDSDPIVFPELILGGVSGMTAYSAGTLAESSTERGQIRASVTLKTTYVVNRGGPHTVAGISVRWLEPRSGRYTVASLPELTLWAAPNPSLGFQCLGTSTGAAHASEVGTFVTLGLLGVAIWRRIRRGPGRWEAELKRRSRERRAFRELVHSARGGSAPMVLRGLYGWLAVRFTGSLDRTLAPLRTSSPEAARATAELERGCFRGEKSTAPPSAFVSMLRRARRSMGRKPYRTGLPSLNPESEGKGES